MSKRDQNSSPWELPFHRASCQEKGESVKHRRGSGQMLRRKAIWEGAGRCWVEWGRTAEGAGREGLPGQRAPAWRREKGAHPGHQILDTPPAPPRHGRGDARLQPGWQIRGGVQRVWPQQGRSERLGPAGSWGAAGPRGVPWKRSGALRGFRCGRDQLPRLLGAEPAGGARKRRRF